MLHKTAFYRTINIFSIKFYVRYFKRWLQISIRQLDSISPKFILCNKSIFPLSLRYLPLRKQRQYLCTQTKSRMYWDHVHGTGKCDKVSHLQTFVITIHPFLGSKNTRVSSSVALQSTNKLKMWGVIAHLISTA